MRGRLKRDESLRQPEEMKWLTVCNNVVRHLCLFSPSLHSPSLRQVLLPVCQSRMCRNTPGEMDLFTSSCHPVSRRPSTSSTATTIPHCDCILVIARVDNASQGPGSLTRWTITCRLAHLVAMRNPIPLHETSEGCLATCIMITPLAPHLLNSIGVHTLSPGGSTS